jgi:hypothetical protein
MKRILYLIAAVSVSVSLSSAAHAEPSTTETSAETPAGAESDQATPASMDYDNVYLEEKRDSSKYPWKIGASLGGEFSDPYLSMQSATLLALRSLGSSEVRRYIAVGVEFNKYLTQDGSLTQNLNGSQIVAVTLPKPQYSGFGVFELTPFQGNVNFITRDPLELALAVRVGAGAMVYDANQAYPSVMWQVAPQVLVSDHVGIEIAGGQEIESPYNSNQRVARWMGQAGAFVRF